MKNIVIVGVGALGSHLVQFIRNCDAKITVIDFDCVEQKNVLSQFYAKNGVGKSKVLALAQLMGFVYGVKLETIPHKLTKDNVNQLLGKADLIVDCLDNGEARSLVQNYARQNKVACLHGGLAADGAFGRVIWDDNFSIDNESGAGAATCENGDYVDFIALTASLMARSVKVFLDNDKQVGYSVTPTGVIQT